MTVVVSCSCRTSFNLKDEFAGQMVECPVCGASVQAGQPRPSTRYNAQSDADPAFARDTFLLRQKALSISQKYTVGDEDGTPILHVVRPAHLLRNTFALFGALVAGYTVLIALLGASSSFRGSMIGGLLVALAVLAFPVTLVGVFAMLSKKRHVTFYRDETKSEKVIEVLQDAKFQPIVATFTLRDARGAKLAAFEKNYIFNLFRRRWIVRGPRGEIVLIAREDSIILSLLRRVLGPLYGLLRTNFVYERPDGRIIGEFKRKFTILDRYVLDLTEDAERVLDRRIAVALGVMLDTGERR